MPRSSAGTDRVPTIRAGAAWDPMQVSRPWTGALLDPDGSTSRVAPSCHRNRDGTIKGDRRDGSVDRTFGAGTTYSRDGARAPGIVRQIRPVFRAECESSWQSYHDAPRLALSKEIFRDGKRRPTTTEAYVPPRFPWQVHGQAPDRIVIPADNFNTTGEPKAPRRGDKIYHSRDFADTDEYKHEWYGQPVSSTMASSFVAPPTRMDAREMRATRESAVGSSRQSEQFYRTAFNRRPPTFAKLQIAKGNHDNVFNRVEVHDSIPAARERFGDADRLRLLQTRLKSEQRLAAAAEAHMHAAQLAASRDTPAFSQVLFSPLRPDNGAHS